jgi:hypothetical protein
MALDERRHPHGRKLSVISEKLYETCLYSRLFEIIHMGSCHVVHHGRCSTPTM